MSDIESYILLKCLLVLIISKQLPLGYSLAINGIVVRQKVEDKYYGIHSTWCSLPLCDVLLIRHDGMR